MEFKEWDRVVIESIPPSLKGNKGTIASSKIDMFMGSIFYAVKLDDYVDYAHDCNGLCENGYGYWIHNKYLTIITNKEETA